MAASTPSPAGRALTVNAVAAGADPMARTLLDLVATRSDVVVIDVGGGSGTSAVPLAVGGCRVVVVDSSIDALAILRRRATEAGVGAWVSGIQGDADRLAAVLPAGERADLVLCHHLLEGLDDPATALSAVASVLKSDGLVSVLTAGRYAAVLAQGRAGRPGDALAMLSDDDGRYGPLDPLRRRFDVAGLQALFEAAGLEVAAITGVGLGTGSAQLEAVLGPHPILRELGADLHAIGRLVRKD